jgi:hypothetical protein
MATFFSMANENPGNDDPQSPMQFPDNDSKPVKPDPDEPYNPIEPDEPDVQPDIIGNK